MAIRPYKQIYIYQLGKGGMYLLSLYLDCLPLNLIPQPTQAKRYFVRDNRRSLKREEERNSSSLLPFFGECAEKIKVMRLLRFPIPKVIRDADKIGKTRHYIFDDGQPQGVAPTM